MPTRQSILRYARGFEHEIARRFHGMRVHTNERYGIDVIAGDMNIQCKHLKRFPRWMDLELRALEHHTAANTKALLIIGGPGQDDPLVVQHLSQYEQWHVGTREEGEHAH